MALDLFGTRQFNAPGDLIGPDAVGANQRAKPSRILSPMYVPQQVTERESDTAEVLTLLPGEDAAILTAAEGAPTTDNPDPDAQEITLMLNGSFSAVQAAFVLHQHRIAFWDPAAYPAYLGADATSDPSETEIDSQYTDFLLFCYLPETLRPTRDEFGQMSRPSARPAFLAARLTRAGVHTAAGTGGGTYASTDRSSGLPTTVGLATVNDTGATIGQRLPIPSPYAEQLSAICNEPLFERALS